MSYFNFRGKIQLDQPVSCHLDSGPLFRVPKLSPLCLSYQLLGWFEIAPGHLYDDGRNEVLLPHPGLRHLHPLFGRERERPFSRGPIDCNSWQHWCTCTVVLTIGTSAFWKNILNVHSPNIPLMPFLAKYAAYWGTTDAFNSLRTEDRGKISPNTARLGSQSFLTRSPSTARKWPPSNQWIPDRPVNRQTILSEFWGKRFGKRYSHHNERQCEVNHPKLHTEAH